MANDTHTTRKRRLWIVALVLAAPFIAYAVGQLFCWLHRPVFHNVFGRNDRMIFSAWVCEPPHLDDQQNAAIADYRLNLLVVFLTGDAGVAPTRFWHPHPAEGGVAFPAEYGEDLHPFQVPRTENTLIVFAADGSHREYPLAPGEAERLHQHLSDAADFRLAIAEATSPGR